MSETKKPTKFITTSGIELKDSYTNADVRTHSEQPGEFPYTRGIHRDMYRGKLWTMRQYAGFGTARETNERYQYLLKQGVTGLSVAFDLPTQMGRDSDAILAKGEVGKVGVAISSIEDMRELFANIPLDQVSVSMTINSTAPILLALYLALADERGVSRDKLNGTIQNDILKEYIARGTYIYPPRGALRLVTDTFDYCEKEVPKWNTISISGYHIREAGATAVQELAFTFSDAIAYVDSAIKRGLKVDRFAPRLAFFFNCHLNFLEEIAKFRAARRIWAKIMQERFGAKDERSLKMRFHTQTAGSSLTAQQPLNNVVRTTMQAMAAVLGGTQSLHTNSFDEALGLPTSESATLALRTQQIIACESGIAASADPLGGSFMVEALTDRLETEAFKLIDRIDELGGMVAAIEARFPQAEIEKSAYEWQRQVESGEQLVVGVNSYQSDEGDGAPEILKLDESSERAQRERLIAFKAARDNSKVKIALESLNSKLTGSDNLMPAIVDCIKANATLGEISDTMRVVFGEYRG